MAIDVSSPIVDKMENFAFEGGMTTDVANSIEFGNKLPGEDFVNLGSGDDTGLESLRHRLITLPSALWPPWHYRPIAPTQAYSRWYRRSVAVPTFRHFRFVAIP